MERNIFRELIYRRKQFFPKTICIRCISMYRVWTELISDRSMNNRVGFKFTPCIICKYHYTNISFLCKGLFLQSLQVYTRTPTTFYRTKQHISSVLLCRSIARCRCYAVGMWSCERFHPFSMFNIPFGSCIGCDTLNFLNATTHLP